MDEYEYPAHIRKEERYIVQSVAEHDINTAVYVAASLSGIRLSWNRLYRTDRPELARTYYQLAEQELQHMELLHRQVVAVIEEYRRNKGEPPAEMQARYDWLHEKQIEHAAEVRVLMAAFNK